MWLLFACGSALFAGVTAVLAKIGMQHINSTIATALRTIIVLLFSWLMVLLTGAFSGIGSISGKTQKVVAEKLKVITTDRLRFLYRAQ